MSCFALREPSAAKRPMPNLCLVSLRHSGSPAVCLRGFASPDGLASQLGEPARLAYGSAFVSPRAQQAGRPSLRSGLGLASRASEPSGFLGGSGNLRLPQANAKAAPCFPALLRQPPLASAFASASALRSAAGCASPSVSLRYNFFNSRLSINPNVSTEAGRPIVDARFIARTLLSRQGWERLWPAG